MEKLDKMEILDNIKNFEILINKNNIAKKFIKQIPQKYLEMFLTCDYDFSNKSELISGSGDYVTYVMENNDNDLKIIKDDKGNKYFACICWGGEEDDYPNRVLTFIDENHNVVLEIDLIGEISNIMYNFRNYLFHNKKAEGLKNSSKKYQKENGTFKDCLAVLKFCKYISSIDNHGIKKETTKVKVTELLKNKNLVLAKYNFDIVYTSSEEFLNKASDIEFTEIANQKELGKNKYSFENEKE